MTRAYDPLLKPLGITYPQLLVMVCLWDYGTSSVDDIGSRLYLDSGTLSPLLKRLAQKGLIVRQRDPADERRVLISLTESGHLMKDQAVDVTQNICKLITLNKDQVRTMIELMTECRRQLTTQVNLLALSRSFLNLLLVHGTQD
jgi:DNA-binding MarR family transcriptional regulator